MFKEPIELPENFLIKHADTVNRATQGGDIVNVENGKYMRKNASFNMKLMKGAENEIWADLCYAIPALGYELGLLNAINTKYVAPGRFDTLHVATLAATAPTTTLQGSTPNNSASAPTTSVVDINLFNQTNQPIFFENVQLESMTFDLMAESARIQKTASMKEIQTQIQIIMLEGLASGNRGERATGDAMTQALLETAMDAILNNGANPNSLYCVHNPATMRKIAAIAEATSGHLLYTRFNTSNMEYLKKGILGELMGFQNIVTELATIDDDWSGREAGVYGSLYFDANALACLVRDTPLVTILPVTTNPGVTVNLQYLWGAKLLNSNLCAGIKMYEA